MAPSPWRRGARGRHGARPPNAVCSPRAAPKKSAVGAARSPTSRSGALPPPRRPNNERLRARRGASLSGRFRRADARGRRRRGRRRRRRPRRSSAACWCTRRTRRGRSSFAPRWAAARCPRSMRRAGCATASASGRRRRLSRRRRGRRRARRRRHLRRRPASPRGSGSGAACRRRRRRRRRPTRRSARSRGRASRSCCRRAASTRRRGATRAPSASTTARWRWPTSTSALGAELLASEHQHGVRALAWQPHARSLLAVGCAGGVYLWQLQLASSAAAFRKRLVRVVALPQAAPAAAPSCALAWHPAGRPAAAVAAARAPSSSPTRGRTAR